MRVVVFLVGLTILLGSCASKTTSPDKTSVKSAAKPPVKNIILFIGDGMGPAYLKAYRLYQDNLSTPSVEPTLFDSILVGALRTDPLGISGEITDSSASAKALATGLKAVNGQVTDSAASATAFATGLKTLNGALSVDPNNRPMPTVLEKAKILGKSTGMVVTSQVYHATPAAFVAHELDRDNYKEIANQFFDNQYQGLPYVDVLLGGGRKHFMGNERNIAMAFQNAGYDFVTSRTEMLASRNDKLLGLFAEIGLDKMFDRDVNTPSLREMTRAAIERLSKNPNGFFLMVEGSQIDWAGHENDIVGVMSEMADFEAAIAEGLNFAKSDAQTQVIVTADHSTGGLSVGARVNKVDHYQWNSQIVRSFKITPNKIVQLAQESGDLLRAFQSATDIPLSLSDQKMLANAPIKDYYQSLAVVTDLINRLSYTGWTTQGHTGVDVNLYAFGPESAKLVGNWDNTKLAEFMFELLQSSRADASH